MIELTVELIVAFLMFVSGVFFLYTAYTTPKMKGQPIYYIIIIIGLFNAILGGLGLLILFEIIDGAFTLNWE